MNLLHSRPIISLLCDIMQNWVAWNETFFKRASFCARVAKHLQAQHNYEKHERCAKVALTFTSDSI